MQKLAPMLGRQEREFTGPMITLSYNLLAFHGRLESPPGEIDSMNIDYFSPAAKAQRSVRVIGMRNFVESVIPLTQIDPSVVDTIDTDAYVQETAQGLGVDPTIIRSPEEVERIRGERRQEREVQQFAEIAEPTSKAIKNISDAQGA